MNTQIKLTQYSHGSGCGCKIAPADLSKILKSDKAAFSHPNLLVGNDTRDDAAVYKLDDERVIISTTDFFMPIVDDPFDFGAIASVNAISDIYAMAGKPLMAIAILGWPLDKLAAEIAGQVIEGAREACRRAGIPLAGGHSIDAPEPIFGLAVTGTAQTENLRTNNSATEGCELYLTKPLGIGIMSTAQKKGILEEKDFKTIRKWMLTLNDFGQELGMLECVKALTDVTGFGLLGHLIEMCEGSKLSARIDSAIVPIIENLDFYIRQKTFPGGTHRNFASYGQKVSTMSDRQKAILCDPQTSGGLLIAVEPNINEPFKNLLNKHNLDLKPIGSFIKETEPTVTVL